MVVAATDDDGARGVPERFFRRHTHKKSKIFYWKKYFRFLSFYLDPQNAEKFCVGINKPKDKPLLQQMLVCSCVLATAWPLKSQSNNTRLAIELSHSYIRKE